MRSGQKPPEFLAPLVLIMDVILAAGFWFARDTFLGPEDTWIAALVSGALVLGGLTAFFVLRHVSKRTL